MEQYTYEQLCEAVQDNDEINKKSAETGLDSDSPENSAPVLREDVVLCTPSREKGDYSTFYSTSISYGLDDLLNTS